MFCNKVFESSDYKCIYHLKEEKVHILEDERPLRNQIHQFVFQMFSHISLASYGRGRSFISFLSLENPLHFRSAFGY